MKTTDFVNEDARRIAVIGESVFFLTGVLAQLELVFSEWVQGIKRHVEMRMEMVEHTNFEKYPPKKWLAKEEVPYLDAAGIEMDRDRAAIVAAHVDLALLAFDASSRCMSGLGQALGLRMTTGPEKQVYWKRQLLEIRRALPLPRLPAASQTGDFAAVFEAYRALRAHMETAKPSKALYAISDALNDLAEWRESEALQDASHEDSAAASRSKAPRRKRRKGTKAKYKPKDDRSLIERFKASGESTAAYEQRQDLAPGEVARAQARERARASRLRANGK